MPRILDKRDGTRCPACGKFVTDDPDGYYAKAPWHTGVILYKCCDEVCGKKYEASPEGQEAINEDL